VARQGSCAHLRREFDGVGGTLGYDDGGGNNTRLKRELRTAQDQLALCQMARSPARRPPLASLLAPPTPSVAAAQPPPALTLVAPPPPSQQLPLALAATARASLDASVLQEPGRVRGARSATRSPAPPRAAAPTEPLLAWLFLSAPDEAVRCNW
jgi:hypothetical protein